MSETDFSLDSQSAAEAAEFLDGRSMVLRWLVAFLQHIDRIPPESLSSWRLYWCNEPGASCMLAHSFRNGTTYVCAEDGFDFESLRHLFHEDLLPERIVADRETASSWRKSSPGMLRSAGRSLELQVLAKQPDAGDGAQEDEAGDSFRTARADEAGALRQLEEMHCREIGLEEIRDFDSLIEAGLVYVVEADGELAGYVCANLSDGKYVHVSGLYVAPAYRGSRLGRVLAVEIARRIAAEHEAGALVDVYSDNAPAIRTYLEAGYVLVGEGLEARYHSDTWR